jgi:dTDP-4-amino-4,6-dideoxygalactose transaminase
MKKEIKFNSLFASNAYAKNLELLLSDYELFRKKHFSNSCINLLKKTYSQSDLFLTHSATGALEMIALALDIQEGDEIILPSFTFVSTANAFALRGAKLVFVDIEMENLGLDPVWVEKAITPKTKAIVAVHYAGNTCKIKELKEIATKNSLFLIEDSAMAFGSNFEGQALGSIGDFGVISFDITKHITASQGGLLLINNKNFSSKLSSIYHVGTNRSAFEENKVPYYEWVELGSKYQMPETNAAILYVQLENQDLILKHLQSLSETYFENLQELQKKEYFRLMPKIQIANNFHEFYLIFPSKNQRVKMSEDLKKQNIEALFHYIPLHLSSFAKSKFRYLGGENTEIISQNLLRLPLHTQLSVEEVEYVCQKIKELI